MYWRTAESAAWRTTIGRGEAPSLPEEACPCSSWTCRRPGRRGMCVGKAGAKNTTPNATEVTVGESAA